MRKKGRKRKQERQEGERRKYRKQELFSECNKIVFLVCVDILKAETKDRNLYNDMKSCN